MLQFLSNAYKPKFHEGFNEVAVFIDFVPQFKIAAETALYTILNLQRDNLNESLEFIGSLADTFEKRRFETVEKGIRQILDKLKRVGSTLKEVLASTIYARVLGQLVDFVLVELISMALRLTDIGEDECQSIPKLLEPLIRVENLFHLENQNISPLQCVKNWKKYRGVISIFAISLVEILSEMEIGGKLDALTKDEVAHFVKSMFAESEIRSGVLLKLKPL